LANGNETLEYFKVLDWSSLAVDEMTVDRYIHSSTVVLIETRSEQCYELVAGNIVALESWIAASVDFFSDLSFMMYDYKYMCAVLLCTRHRLEVNRL
jgi:hypothetical protein